MWFTRKKPALPQTNTHPWAGDRADAAQLEVYVSGDRRGDERWLKEITRDQMLTLDREIQALLTTFFQLASDASRAKSPGSMLRAWRFAQGHAMARRAHNTVAFMSVPDYNRAVTDMKSAFVQEASSIFGANTFVQVDGEQMISTRTGGVLWYMRQAFLVLVNPVEKTTKVTQQGGGSQKTEVTKVGLHWQPDLFDDAVMLSGDGVIVMNASSGTDRFVVPWAQATSLIITTNAAFWADPINERILPLSKKWANKQWVPVGTMEIKDRQSGKMLVQVLMPRPDEFRRRLEQLIKRMQSYAIAPSRVDPIAPVELDMFIAALPGSVREDILDLLQMNGRCTRRKFDQTLGQQIFTFQGRQYADQATMETDIQKAFRAIVREPDSDVRRERLIALQTLACKLRPFAGNSLGKLLDKVISIKPK